MRCRSCGAEMGASDEFCGECGRPAFKPIVAQPVSPAPGAPQRAAGSEPVLGHPEHGSEEPVTREPEPPPRHAEDAD